RRSGSAHPDTGLIPVGRVVESWDLLQRIGVVSEDPSVVGADMACGGKRNVNDSVLQQQPRTLKFIKRIEGEVSGAVAAGPGSRNRGSDIHGPTKLFCAGAEIQRVQPLEVTCGAPVPFLGLRHQKEGSRGRVDNWRPRDSDFGHRKIVKSKVA